MIHTSKDTITPIEGEVGKKVDHLACTGGKMMTNIQFKAEDFEIEATVPFTGKVDLTVPPVPELKSGLPKIEWDAELGGVVQCYAYFEAVYQKLKSEAFVWWHWDKTAKQYLMVVPAFYYASGGSLHYEVSTQFCSRCQVGLMDGHDHCPHCGDEEVIEPLNILGTSHSHGSMAAFHSSTDHDNELDTTGFHITFGKMNDGPVMNVAGSFVVADAKHRFMTKWQDHFALAGSEAADWRLALWLTLVASSGSMSGSSYVEDSHKRTVYAGSEAMCKRWVESMQKHRDEKFEISKKPIKATKYTPTYQGGRTYFQSGNNDKTNHWRPGQNGTGHTTKSWDQTKTDNRSSSLPTKGKTVAPSLSEIVTPPGCDMIKGREFARMMATCPDYLVRDAVLVVYATLIDELVTMLVEDSLNHMIDLAPGTAAIEEIGRLQFKDGETWLTEVVDAGLEACNGTVEMDSVVWLSELCITSFSGLSMSDGMVTMYESEMWDLAEHCFKDEDTTVTVGDSGDDENDDTVRAFGANENQHLTDQEDEWMDYMMYGDNTHQ